MPQLSLARNPFSSSWLSVGNFSSNSLLLFRYQKYILRKNRPIELSANNSQKSFWEKFVINKLADGTYMFHRVFTDIHKFKTFSTVFDYADCWKLVLDDVPKVLFWLRWKIVKIGLQVIRQHKRNYALNVNWHARIFLKHSVAIRSD